MATDLLIRRAVPVERALLVELQRRASLEWSEYRDALLAEPGAISLPAEQIFEGRVHVAERGGEIVGFSVVLPRSDGQAELDGLFVEPAAWRTGVGRELVRRAAHETFRAGATFLRVIATPHARCFYIACGFEPIGEEPTRFGTGILMRKLLAAD
jgi:GNAT superfamily N-acetyltransferase